MIKRQRSGVTARIGRPHVTTEVRHLLVADRTVVVC